MSKNYFREKADGKLSQWDSDTDRKKDRITHSASKKSCALGRCTSDGVPSTSAAAKGRVGPVRVTKRLGEHPSEAQKLQLEVLKQKCLDHNSDLLELRVYVAKAKVIVSMCEGLKGDRHLKAIAEKILARMPKKK